MEYKHTTVSPTLIEPQSAPLGWQYFARTMRWLIGTGVGLALFNLWLGCYLSTWQYIGLFSISSVATLVFWIALRMFNTGKTVRAAMMVVWTPLVFAPLCVLLLENALFPFALTVIFMPPFLASLMLPREKAPLVWMWSLLAASVTAVFNYLVPWSRYDVSQTLFTQIGVYISLAFAVLVAFIELLRGYRRIMVIRYRLLSIFVLVVALAVIGTAGVSVLMNFRFAQQQAFDRLEAIAELQQVAVDTWLEGLKFDLDSLLTTVYELTYVRAVVGQDESSNFEYATAFLRSHFQKMVQRTHRFDEIFLLNLAGRVMVSTDVDQQGQLLLHKPFFQEGLTDSYVQFPRYDVSHNGLVVYVAQPVKDLSENIIGVLVGRVNLGQLNTIMLGRDVLKKNGETYLVTTDSVLLTQGLHAEINSDVQSTYIDDVLMTQKAVQTTAQNYDGTSSYAVAKWLDNLQVVLVAELDADVALQSAQATALLSGVFSVVAVIVAVVVAQWLAQSITQPLSNLAVTATRIADGEMELVATVEREDEVGALAMAFNSMTKQLRELISGLELRIEERTRGLAAVTDVSRATTSLLDPEKLLPQVVNLVRDRFNLYYVGLFLVDDLREYAVLRAATGNAGREMMAKNWRLLLGGESMIGQCVITGSAGVKQTAGDATVRFENPYLPNTRSELALPLRYGNRIMGSMTVQSDVESAFDDTYIALLQNMADQVAVAVQNARLFAETQAALTRARETQQRYQGLAWDQYIQGRRITGYEQRDVASTPLGETLLPEVADVVRAGQTVIEPGRLVMPIIQDDRVVGVLGFECEERMWSADDVALIEALSEQLVLASENQRLLDVTQRTAAREQTLGQVTGRVREELYVENVLRTAVDEIQRALGLDRLVVRMVPHQNEW